MSRLISTMHWDIQLQFRNGFYYATAFIIAFWALLMSQVPAFDIRWLLPAMVLGNLLMTTFYFVAGLILLEKDEGTLEAQVVTPLRTGEYLAVKVLTLTLLALIENLILVVLLAGFDFASLPLLSGIALGSAIFVLAGFISVVRYPSINEYLFPSILYASPLTLPLLPYLMQWEHWLLYLHPLQAPLVLMHAAFHPIAVWQIIYGVVYSAVWIGIFFIWSQRLFQRFVVAQTAG